MIPIFYFKKPEQLHGTKLRQELIDEGVLTETESPDYALNLVRSWDAYLISIIVMLPMVLSLLMCILWTLIAVLQFGADVQTSAQTAFTIGSYMITAGIVPIE